MKYLLAARQAETLERFASAPTLLVFAFDGTLAPLASDRQRAALRPATSALLRRVMERFSCAVVSARARADVVARLSDLPFRWVVGNHGSEREDVVRPEQDAAKALVRAARSALAREPFDDVGIELEDKGLSLSLHYGGARDKEAARSVIDAGVAAAWPGARALPGKQVAHLLPAGAEHKGHAVDWLRSQAGISRVLYLGDDLTDEDVFRKAPPQDEAPSLLAVRVQKSARTAAPYYLANQGELDELLARLVALRAPGSP